MQRFKPIPYATAMLVFSAIASPAFAKGYGIDQITVVKVLSLLSQVAV